VLPRIHLVTDGQHTSATFDIVNAAVRSGFEAVQIRAKHLTDRELLEYTEKIIEQVAPSHAKVIVHDRVDIAVAAGADGVLLDRDDVSIHTARQLATDEGFLIGSTCRIADHARRALEEGADYVAVGPLFPTATVTGSSEPVGWDVLHESAEVLPVIAAGGIDGDRVQQVIAAGAYGVAVYGAVANAADPGEAAAEIVRAVRACIGTIH
jgi:thiamine-phosphate pyrophosphorylase